MPGVMVAAVMGVLACGQARSVDVIAFGSCAREREDQPVWDRVLAAAPDVFLFIGDNQYADFWPDETGKVTMHPVTEPGRILEAYRDLAAKPGFQRLRETCPVMATWDDHDFGANDGGADYPLREQSKSMFFDFFGFDAGDARRANPGVYQAAVFGPRDRRVQVIMLDTRYNRDPLETGPREAGKGPYVPTSDTGKTILGEAQWAWLGAQLREPADVRIIASSIQVIADEHRYETWGNFPHERERLYRLIDETDASGVVFISGDRHLMEVCRDIDHGAPYPMWDFTSSGMTQAKQTINEPNSDRVGPVFRETNFGVIELHWGDSSERTRIDFVGYGDAGQMLTRESVFLSELHER